VIPEETMDRGPLKGPEGLSRIRGIVCWPLHCSLRIPRGNGGRAGGTLAKRGGGRVARPLPPVRCAGIALSAMALRVMRGLCSVYLRSAKPMKVGSGQEVARKIADRAGRGHGISHRHPLGGEETGDPHCPCMPGVGSCHACAVLLTTRVGQWRDRRLRTFSTCGKPRTFPCTRSIR